MHDVVDLVIAICLQQLRLGAVLQILGELLGQICQGPAQPLDVFEAIGAGAGTAGVLDLFLPGRYLCDGTRRFATRIPEIDLERQSVATRMAVNDPL
jgi:hypothetical protein